jgi:uncharacterized RDD family membrane protein YckC
MAFASALTGMSDVVRGCALVACYLGYYFLSEGLWGATPAKLLFGLRVRSLAGGRCSWLQAGIRTVLRVIEVNPFLFGGLPAGIAILATTRRQRLGDLWAGTVVVANWKSQGAFTQTVGLEPQ